MTEKSPSGITVFDIANWFLTKAQSENKPLKPMKLQKLVYFAYGWYSAFFDQFLFQEEIYAWRYGPVVKDLYDKYKPFRKNPIIVETYECPVFDDDLSAVLQRVWELYSACTDFQLSAITHRPNAPWSQKYRRDEWIPYVVIEPELIRDYFKSIRIGVSSAEEC